LGTAPIRVLVVDDYKPWRRFFSATLRKRPDFRVISEASDGLEAVQKAQELQPDIILLDIGLPTVNGIEAARRIREVSPASKILFVSENRSVDIAKEALNTGAGGYVVKSDAAKELLPALRAVLKDERFISAYLMTEGFSDLPIVVPPPPARKLAANGSHRCEFYRDDASLVEGFTEYIKSALECGAAVTFVATESHRASVLQRLKAHALDDLGVLIGQGRYNTVDVMETLPMLIGEDGRLDLAQCSKVLGELIARAPKTVTSGRNRIVACGEFAPVLLKEGKIEAAVEMEHLTNEFTRKYNIDVFCGYSYTAMPLKESSSVLRRIRLEHSVVSGRYRD
jgi:DNA-binding NarL/FixJ family response regulator